MAGSSGQQLSGESDLAMLLARMKPTLHEARYSFRTGSGSPPDAFAIIRENEGMTIIAPSPDGDWARISLAVHSSLSAVGLSAAVAKTLADYGISANIVAGYYHDHIFMPWERRHEAMVALKTLSEKSS